MEYSKLLDLATDLGYHLAMNGAETFRVEESILRLLAAYGVTGDAFVIPNCMHISILTEDDTPIARMRRIGGHGSNLDAVERYSNLSRKLCMERPDLDTAIHWLKETKRNIRSFNLPWLLFGNAFGAFGFSLLFGGSVWDALLSAVCGLVVGLVNYGLDHLDANPFFKTIAAAFPMALLAYISAALIPGIRADMVAIGALMLLVPGLLFTNAMRDIIYGDTNSGINRMVQVLLIAVAIALGVAAAWNVADLIHEIPVSQPPIPYNIAFQCLASFFACIGFAIIYNIHGPGIFLCALGGVFAWAGYAVSLKLGVGEIAAYFISAVVASLYSEILARIRKYPATSYLVVSIFPLIPGSGVYYTILRAMEGDMERFASQGIFTLSIAGAMALGILLVVTIFRMTTARRKRK
ncbi:MAG: threonine/serine exporter family protein [Ruminococcaceae bacterium]|nr:threonine/serine exporter family protein [Oscillospiraceae bacterium]